ncbi:MAG: ATP-binding protein, partial [Fibrobacter sp.]|nr:ATP-binding protein [Fibrobacter sp.]
LESIITKFMGETAAKLRIVFDALQKHRGIYLFDEFDSIGAMRAAGNDVGEIRRILNSFLQFIDHDCSNSMILAATNHPQMLDYALFRRFDDVIEYSLPDAKQIRQLIENRLAGFSEDGINYADLAKRADGLSFAEITRACEDAIKEKIIMRKEVVGAKAVARMLDERKKYHSSMTSTYDTGRA